MVHRIVFRYLYNSFTYLDFLIIDYRETMRSMINDMIIHHRYTMIDNQKDFSIDQQNTRKKNK